MIKKIKKQLGFTLIEVLLTCIILGTGLFGLMILYANSMDRVVDSDINLVATYLARERLEQLISDKVHNDYSTVINTTYTTSEVVTAGNHSFTRSFNIYEVDPADLVTPQADSGYKRIDMTVSWGAEPTQTMTIPTIVTDYSF
jgi:type IV pilus assembly protein PilV